MEFELLCDSNKIEWNAFCLENDACWFRHTTDWMDYIKSCRFDSNSENHSFLIRQNKELVAVVPLISQYIYGVKGQNEFANYDTPTPCFAIKNGKSLAIRENVSKFVMDKIDELAISQKISRAKMCIEPLMSYDFFDNFKEFNFLKNDYLVDVKTTNILDLTLDTDSILRQMRKGHRADIKSVLKSDDYRIDIFNKDNCQEEMSIFKEIHRLDAGRQTRTDESWNCMSKWVKEGNAILVLVWIKSLEKYCAGALFMTYKHRAYYASYATIDASLLDYKIGHLVQWEAMTYLKEHSCQYYDIGKSYYKNNFNGSIDKKLMDISRFKRGFGGKEVLFLSFEKDY